MIGQGSIFDLRRGRRGAQRPGGAFAHAHPPILGEEFEQNELLAAEKEAIGLFISEHPLKPLKEVLRARTDCPLSALAGPPRQGPGDGRRDHHRDEADPHAQRRLHDVRDARRPRRRRRDARLRQGARRVRVGARRRRDRAREGPRRPQGSGQHVPDRAGGPALRALGRGDRARAREGQSRCAPARGAGAAAATCRPMRAQRPLAEGDRVAQAGLRGLPGRRPTCWPRSSSSRTGTRRQLRLGDDLPRREHADAAGRARQHPARRAGRAGGMRAGRAARRITPAGARRRRSPSEPQRRRAARPRSRRRLASPISAGPGPSRFSPGVSSTQGSRWRPGAERNAAQPFSPSSPSPTLA